MDPSNPCLGEIHAPLFHMNTGVLHFTFNVHDKSWKLLHLLLFVWKQKMPHIVLNNLTLGNCFELSSRSCLSSCIM